VMSGSSPNSEAIIKSPKQSYCCYVAFSTDAALAGRMPDTVIIEYNVTPSEGASVYSALGELKM
jgi:hypothetical protein